VPGVVFALAWLALAIVHGAHGPLELALAPLALVRGLRSWIWLVALGLHATPGGLSAGLVLLHVWTFDPAWIRRARRSGGKLERVYYDGSCGLCHGAVRFVLAEDRGGEAFRFAPLEGNTALQRISASQRAALPDSLVVETALGELLTRSSAILHIAAELGGPWRLLAGLGAWVPVRLRDSLYDSVARVRRRLAPAPDGACPLVPRETRRRFDP
jgi:predicted DCC family thiol-disulfide oxidoreductase YuxK